MAPPRSLRHRIAPRHDRHDIRFIVLFGGAGIGALGVSLFWSPLTATHVIALIAILTGFVAVYQLRHSEESTPAVRQEFKYSNKHGAYDFGLKNFGPGPVMNIQLAVFIDDERQFLLGPIEKPLHIPEGGYIGLIHDEKVSQTNQLSESVLTVDDNHDIEETDVELYYSYTSNTGVREPRHFEYGSEDTVFFDEDFTGDDQKPRKISLKQINEHCL